MGREFLCRLPGAWDEAGVFVQTRAYQAWDRDEAGKLKRAPERTWGRILLQRQTDMPE